MYVIDLNKTYYIYICVAIDMYIVLQLYPTYNSEKPQPPPSLSSNQGADNFAIALDTHHAIFRDGAKIPLN